MPIRLLAPILVLLVIGAHSLGDTNHPFPVDEPDGRPWKYQSKGRIVAIGDIHANGDALLTILEKLKVISPQGSVIAKDTDVVLMGDLIDKGAQSRFVLDYIPDLRDGLEKRNCRLHILQGNHEAIAVMMAQIPYVSKESVFDFADFAPMQLDQFFEDLEVARKNRRVLSLSQKEIDELVDWNLLRLNLLGFYLALTSEDSPYSAEIGNRNTIIQIGEPENYTQIGEPENYTTFVHAGLGDWVLGQNGTTHRIPEINATTRRLIKEHQTHLSSDLLGKVTAGDTIVFPDSNHWLLHMGGDGPLWTLKLSRRRDLAEYSVPESEFSNYLAVTGSSRLVSAHVMTESRKIEQDYNGRYFKIDTKITSKSDGKLSALEIVNETVTLHDEIPRLEGPHPARIALDQKYRRNRGKLLTREDVVEAIKNDPRSKTQAFANWGNDSCQSRLERWTERIKGVVLGP